MIGANRNRRIARGLVAILLPLILSACFHADLVMDKNGPVDVEKAPADSQTRQFAQLWTDAKSAAQAVVDGNNGLVTPQEVAANRRLLDAGMALVYNSCNDFFISEGRWQQGLNFSKDLTGALVPNLGGALSLIPSAGISQPMVGFIGGGITAGISVADANFLFGSSNIDNVRTLTLNALAAHENSVRAIYAQSMTQNNKNLAKAATRNADEPSLIVANFFWVTKQIADNQALCQPGKILDLSRQAIAQANVCPTTSASSTNGQADAATPSSSPNAAAGKGSSATAKPTSAPTGPVPDRVIVKVQPSCDPTTPPKPS